MLHEAAIGLRAHSGWAVLVAVGGRVTSPAVVQRRRIELADDGIPGSVQPYHAAWPMQLEKAEAFLERCAGASRAMAQKALQTAIGDLATQGYKFTGSCILLKSGRPTRELAAVLASHPAIHTAEGEFFRNALRMAHESCGLAISAVKERELLNLCAAVMDLGPDEIERRVAAVGKAIGPPWRQDEKLCALAAWLVLASQSGQNSPASALWQSVVL
jgi:hypothetical protein